MPANDLLKEVYKKFWEQREVLADAPVLSQDPNSENFDIPKAETELAKLISYFMGVEDIQKTPFEQSINIIKTHYDSQPEWQELLVNYMEYVNEKEEESLLAQESALIEEVKEFTKKLLTKEETSLPKEP